MGVLHSFSIKNILYDKMDLKLFCLIRRDSRLFPSVTYLEPCQASTIELLSENY